MPTDSNKLTVVIDRPIAEVYLFTIDPQNTPKWIESIAEEQADIFPPKLGTKYKNVNRAGEWSHYIVSGLEENRIFELMSADGKYSVRYTYTPIPANSTELEYFEWMNEGRLENPFHQKVMEKLKRVMEAVS